MISSRHVLSQIHFLNTKFLSCFARRIAEQLISYSIGVPRLMYSFEWAIINISSASLQSIPLIKCTVAIAANIKSFLKSIVK